MFNKKDILIANSSLVPDKIRKTDLIKILNAFSCSGESKVGN